MDEPELILGPDEEFMSGAEKRRYIELAERSKINFLLVTCLSRE